MFTAAIPGKCRWRVRGSSRAWPIPEGPLSANTQATFLLGAGWGSLRELVSSHMLNTLAPRIPGVKGLSGRPSPRLSLSDKSAQHRKRPCIHSLRCITCPCECVQPACGGKQSLSLLRLPSPGPLLPLCVRHPGQFYHPHG